VLYVEQKPVITLEFEEMKKIVIDVVKKHNRIARILANSEIPKSDIVEILPLILYTPKFKDEDYKQMMNELCETVLAVKKLVEMGQLKLRGKIEKEEETFYIA